MTQQMQTWADRLTALGLAVRKRLIQARDAGHDMATAVAQEGGDTIFAIDRHVEPVIEEHARSWREPLTLVAEGLGENGRASIGDGGKVTVLIDPIDGTRNIMYDKRAAWFIAAACNGSTLSTAFAAAIVELPTSKQGFADAFAATADGAVLATRMDLRSGGVSPLPVKPSGAATLEGGFGQVANFFPGTKVLASQLMERIVEATMGRVVPGSASVFDDQYISTAGQMVELMVGHDRFCCDLRPLFYRVLEKRSGASVRGLECHPYDVAGLLVARRAGVIVTDGFGQPLDAPLDVHAPVHWCGYANQTLRQKIEPVIRAFFAEHGVQP